MRGMLTRHFALAPSTALTTLFFHRSRRNPGSGNERRRLRIAMRPESLVAPYFAAQPDRKEKAGGGRKARPPLVMQCFG